MITLINLACQPLHMPGVNGVIEDLAESGVPIVIVRRRVGSDSEVVIYRPVMRRVVNTNDWARLIAELTEYYDCRVVVRSDKDQVIECHPA